MDTSPGSDRMDWAPSSPPIIYYHSQEQWNNTVAGQRRTFEQFSDGTEPRGRQNDTNLQAYVPRYGPGQPNFFPPDDHLGIIPRYATRTGLCFLYFGDFVLGHVGHGVEYASVAVKRRIIRALGVQPAAGAGQYDTPRQRRRRNIYLTPRQMYEQRSLRSIRIRDMPGRYPGFPQSCYTNADPYGQRSQRALTSPMDYAPEIRDVASGEPLDAPSSTPSDSPLVLKQRRTAPSIETDDRLTQEMVMPSLGAIDPAPQNNIAPLISTLDEDLDQEKKQKEALESTAAQSIEIAPTPPALSFDSSDSSDPSDSDERLTDLDTTSTSLSPTADTSSQLNEESESEILNSASYDPNEDPTLAIVPEAQGLENWEMQLTEESYFVPMVHKQKRRPSTKRRAVDIPKRFINLPTNDEDSHEKATMPATDTLQDHTEDSLIASDEEEGQKQEKKQENKLNCVGAVEETESSACPPMTVPIAASTKESLTTAPEIIFEVDVESGVQNNVGESAACSAESSDNSRSLALTASISPQRSALSPLHHNAVSAARQQTANQSNLLPRGAVPNMMSKLAHYFGYREPNSSQQTPIPHTHQTSPKLRKTVGFYESPETGRPVTRTKRFVIGESIDHPSPLSSRDESSLLSDVGSQSGGESSTVGTDQMALDSQLQIFQPIASSESGLLSPTLGEVSCNSTETSGENTEESCDEDAEMSDAPAEDFEADTGLMEGNPGSVAEENQSQVQNTGMEKEEDHLGEDEGSSDGEKNDASEQEEGHIGQDDDGTDGEKDDASNEDEDPTNDDIRTDQDASIRESEDRNAPQEESSAAEQDNHEEEPSGENNEQPATPQTKGLFTRKASKKMKRKDLSGALEELSITQEINVSPRRVSARRRSLAEKEAQEKAAQEKKEAEEKAKREKEEAERRAQLEREAEERRRKLGGRQYTKEPAIQPLSAEWNRKVDDAMSKGLTSHIATTSSGNPISRRDMGMVLPQRGDDPSGWLNDEIIAGYLQAVVDYGNARFNLKRGDTPKLHAFNSFFYTNLRKPGGYENVKRWARRAKVGGKDLLKVEWVFIPVNVGGNHWTLAVVSPVRKTIEYFDSMHGSATQIVNNIRGWLAGELENAYVADEWVVRGDDEGRYVGRGKGPTQTNGSDCGVFTVTTAKMISLGIEPLAFSAQDTPLQRRRIVAELMNGGFNGEFEPKFEFV